MLHPPTDTHFEIYVTDAEVSESRRRTRWVYQRVCLTVRPAVVRIFDVWTRPVVGTKVLRVAFPPEVTRPYVRTTRQFEAGQNLRFRGRLN